MKIQLVLLLKGYIASQKKSIAAMMDKITVSETQTEEQATYTAYLLHNVYCALEDLFRETAHTFENSIDRESSFHRELIKRMSIDIPGIRPRFLSDTSIPLVDELRAFRHVFRHAYTYSLDPAKVDILKKSLLVNWKIIADDIDAFEKFIDELIMELKK